MMQHYYRLIGDEAICFNVELAEPLSDEESKILNWLLAETFEPEKLSLENVTLNPRPGHDLIHFGPRLNFATPWSTNALSICHNLGLTKIKRMEKSRLVQLPIGTDLEDHYDRMTETVYEEELKTFDSGLTPEPLYSVPLLTEGIAAFDKIAGLSMDLHDKQVYYRYFVEKCGRNPTIAEILDLNNANSEHSRHGYFKGKQIIDGVEKNLTLMEIVQLPWKKSSPNSLIAFSDNSSAIIGHLIKTLLPREPGKFSILEKRLASYHLIFTAETHNFPSGIAPFPGAETGTGGRIRDVQATGRGGLVIAGTTGYCVGNLYLPNYKLPWEREGLVYPPELASPLEIMIKASNGASDYGNKFGEPVIQGFVHAGALHLPNQERREWLKPILFTGGIGQIDNQHLRKEEAQKGMLIIQIGGPAYRIGFGGGAASSLMQGENEAKLDFNAVQRGNGEMEQKMNRVVRACIEMGEKNPIISIHDQGAGGPANVLKELVEKAGGTIDLCKINVDDPSMSEVEIWVAEFQERNGLLIWPDRLAEFQAICQRERVNCEVLGEVTGDGIFTVNNSRTGNTPVRLHLHDVLGGMPQKTFTSKSEPLKFIPLQLPRGLTVKDALHRVFKLIDIGSKRFLTNKVDRSVTGLIVQQQCCGSVHLPVADVAVVAHSHFPDEEGRYSGGATAIGEQPYKMLLNPAAGARMAVAEALTNLSSVVISSLEHVKCSANWMGAPKLPGEGPKLYAAAEAMSDFMIKLGIAVDGGKDSLSMATKVKLANNQTEIVKSPLELVISAYCSVSDVTKVASPDFKYPGESQIIYLGLAGGKRRLGGSALAQAYNQLGDDCPDVEDVASFKIVFNFIQYLIEKDLISAIHDVSGGGLITTLLEMAFSGNCGFRCLINSSKEEVMANLFAEEVGYVFEVKESNFKELQTILSLFYSIVDFQVLGKTTLEKRIVLQRSNQSRPVKLMDVDMRKLRELWEETGHQLEKQQCNPACVEDEKKNIFDHQGMPYKLSFIPKPTPKISETMPKVMILREEGSNGDREMASAFYTAGFQVYDTTMTDLLEGKATLDDFQGLAFVGGFSYADTLDSAKGWSGTILHNEHLSKMFRKFYFRHDTFSLGVCNGCQLMALLGWVPWRTTDTPTKLQPRFIKNRSGRFESRFLSVKIEKSPAIMFKGMVGSTLGIWSAHGEGLLQIDKTGLEQALEANLIPLFYSDDCGNKTENYPFNPNGSPRGIAGLCDPTGRHLAMMPHPERSFLLWQLAYLPEDLKKNLLASPWLKMFQNAREWCLNVGK